MDKSLGPQMIRFEIRSQQTLLASSVESRELYERPDGSLYLKYNPHIEVKLAIPRTSSWTHLIVIEVD